MVAYKGQARATPAEKAHMARVKEMPCCLCGNGLQETPTEVHHLIRGNKRLGHFYVLPYCVVHHRVAFLNTRYERQLWERLNEKMGIARDWPTTKILPRLRARK